MSWHRVTRGLLGVLVLACVTSACGGGAQTDDVKRTVRSFYGALRSHDAATACRLVTPAVARDMLRASHQAGKSCVPALRRLFAEVSSSAFPDFFDAEPRVGTVSMKNNHAAVTLIAGRQTRSMGLVRESGEWKISASPGFS